MNLRHSFLYSSILLLFVSCKQNIDQKQDLTLKDEKLLIVQGKEIASQTFLALSTELKMKIEVDGIEGAIEYCSLNAMPLTEELARKHDAVIKRTSLKTRNPENRANENEAEILRAYESKLERQETLTPIIIEDGDKYIFHAPIITQELCLKCHGEVENMPHYPKIKSIYPEDTAIDYKAGDLRGMWSIALSPIKQNEI